MDPTRRKILKSGAAATAMAAARVFTQQTRNRSAAMSFYERGPVRIYHNEAGSGFPWPLVAAFTAVMLAVLSPALLVAQQGAGQGAAPRAERVASPNYDLAAQWTSEKVRKLVFDTSVTPRWLETSDRFWYSYQTREGRKFSLVDPIKRTKTPLFDHARMAATLTSITRIPYDAQHLPFTSVRFVKKDTAFEFDVQVPADASIATPPKRETTTEQNGGAQGTKAGPAQGTKVKGGAGDSPSDDPGVQVDDPQRGGQSGNAATPARPRNRTLHFEYDLATARVTFLDAD